MKVSKPTIASVVTLMILAPATAAIAAPWDGSDITFANGQWNISSDSFKFSDVNVISPADSLSPTFDEYTDLWDTAGEFLVSFDDWETSDTMHAIDDSSLDISDDAETGDKVISAPMDSQGSAWDGVLSVDGEMRIFSAGDLVRSTFFVTNETAFPVTASFQFHTNFGSSGEIWSYQGQSDSILPVPAAEDSASSDALNEENVQWVVHIDEADAPGAVAYGSKSADHPGLIIIDDDDYDVFFNEVVIPAGQTYVFVEFHSWSPALLIQSDYENGSMETADYESYAAAVTLAAAEFESFSGRLTNGLTGYNVVNWGNVPANPDPTLANTGSDQSNWMNYALASVLLLLLGGSGVLLRRRLVN